MNVAKLVKTTNLTAGDQLILFDGTDYSSWVLNAELTAWEPLNIQASDNPLKVAVTAGAANATLARGQGIWLVRKNLFRCCQGGIYDHLTSTLCQRTGNVCLRAKIHQRNLQACAI